jgi:hypothetical protein
MADDVQATISSFINGLPATIKPGLVATIAGFYSGRPSLDTAQAESIIAEALQSQDVLAAPRALAFLCAAVDHVLVRDSAHRELGINVLKRAAQDTGNKNLESAVLGEPLRGKHLEQARADWNLLRSDQLSVQRIVDYEYNLLRKTLSALR